MIEESSEPSLPVRVYLAAWRVVKAARFILSMAAIGLVGLADQFDLVDVLHTVKGLLGESAKAGTVLVIIAGVYFAAKSLAPFIRKKTEEESES